MSNDESVFSFELNESLFFERGQEVAEMRGISLDPEISIQTFNDYISIVGRIELRGEFKKELSTEEEKITDFTDYHAKRYVEKVVDTVNNVATFSHHFPVEISVPAYRVSDINDITVNIEAFDYEIPEPSQLKLYSTIEIHGINSEIEAPLARERKEVRKETEESLLQAEAGEVKAKESVEEVEELIVESLREEPEEVTDVESKQEEADEVTDKASLQEEVVREEAHATLDQELKEHEEQTEQEEAAVERVPDDQTESFSPGDAFQFELKEKQKKESIDQTELLHTDPPPALLPENESEEDSASPDRWKYKQTQTLAEFFNKLPSQEPETAPETESETDSAQIYDSNINDTPSSSASISVEADVESTELYESSSERVKDVTYLSDMFRSSEEHQYTKMRLCIVQDQDTIETIAERYHISALQLIKQNHLDDEFTITQGQLLYIPDQNKK